jgi:hypothetical protein
MVATFDDTRATLIQRVDKLRKGGSADGLFQAVLMAAQAIQNTGAPFSAIVVVVANPGGAVPAEFAPVLDSGANVHVVVQETKKKTSAGAVQARRQSLETLVALVNETRGQLTEIYAPEAYRPALDRLANQLAGELVIEYIVPAGSSRKEMQLGVRIPGAKINNWGVSPR